MARYARVAGFAALGVGVLSVATGLFLTWQATSVPGLGLADQQRRLSNGIAEAIVSVVPSVIAAAPALIASWWVLRKGRAG